MKCSTPNCIVYGETGVKPLSIDIETRIISYWCKLVNPNDAKLSCIMYNYMLSNYEHSLHIRRGCFKWINYVKTIIIKCGLAYVWNEHTFPNQKWLAAFVRQSLSDLFLYDWYSKLDTSSKCKNYRLYRNLSSKSI